MFERRQDKTSRVVGFGIFYEDGSSYLGKDRSDWDGAPKEGTQLILLYHEDDDGYFPIRTSICGWDYYAFNGTYFRAGNDTRDLDGDLKYGKWMETEEYRQIVLDALRNYRKPDFEGGESQK